MLGGDRSAEDHKEDAEEVKDDVTSDESMTEGERRLRGRQDPGAPG
jgi:hypothetical protein